ncbi:cellulose synthase complex periplasmic endoglucanase BcsZ [Marinobacterium marinum]|uniref:cellulase n=1 Tax=Marinobacterium marinum TaxID=2756129 RepID=A0A7W2AAV8_9GAMM|nr:cellulose synthase complex periplasmic endoglucanase BcsZ [Marinobacterium marinum]MBA4500832.1 cellulase [Marinobacterium marinum]
MRLASGVLFWLLVLAGPVRGEVWPAWEQYKAAMMSDDGRIIDHSSPRAITTSEGQSYGLFFALVANDREGFDRLLNWTENNLADGNLATRLPAWLWGQNDHGDWGVLDSNNASDSDLWIAYSLLEAGRLWQEPDYTRLGRELLWRSAAQSLQPMRGLGLGLLPGNIGFESDQGWRLNPSYLPLQLLARFEEESLIWGDVADSSRKMLLEAAPAGLAPDWLWWHRETGWDIPVDQSGGSYDAIRVYLWLGMLAQGAPGRELLIEQYVPMVSQVGRTGLPPEHVDSLEGMAQGTGPVGFSAALLPLLAARPEWQPLLQQQLDRVQAQPPEPRAYYNNSLLLFGLGWHQGFYCFDKRGRLRPAWLSSCE